MNNQFISIMDKRKNNGGKREGAGRKPKAVEKTIQEYTEPHIAEAVERVVKVMKTAKKDSDILAAAKILMEYNWGRPKQQTDVTTNGKDINIPLSTWADE